MLTTLGSNIRLQLSPLHKHFRTQHSILDSVQITCRTDYSRTAHMTKKIDLLCHSTPVIHCLSWGVWIPQKLFFCTALCLNVQQQSAMCMNRCAGRRASAWGHLSAIAISLHRGGSPSSAACQRCIRRSWWCFVPGELVHSLAQHFCLRAHVIHESAAAGGMVKCTSVQNPIILCTATSYVCLCTQLSHIGITQGVCVPLCINLSWGDCCSHLYVLVHTTNSCTWHSACQLTAGFGCRQQTW